VENLKKCGQGANQKGMHEVIPGVRKARCLEHVEITPEEKL
jgi:hypothetical protein